MSTTLWRCHSIDLETKIYTIEEFPLHKMLANIKPIILSSSLDLFLSPHHVPLLHVPSKVLRHSTHIRKIHATTPGSNPNPTKPLQCPKSATSKRPAAPILTPFPVLVGPAGPNKAGTEPVVGVAEAIAAVRPDTLAKGIVLAPTTSELLAREMTVPFSVIAEPPMDRSVPPIASPEGSAVKVSPSMVKTLGVGPWLEMGPLVTEVRLLDAGVAYAKVEEPTTRPPEARDMTVPWSVIAAPEMERVVPSIATDEEPSGMNVSPLAVSGDLASL